jgi:hypothetical protein
MRSACAVASPARTRLNHLFDREPMRHPGICAAISCHDLFRRNRQPGILKDRRERRASAIRERIGPALAIVRDESPNGHGLHRMCEDADRRVIDAGP